MENKLESGEILKTHEIEGTPFRIVELLQTENTGLKNCFIAVGNKRITELNEYNVLAEKIYEKDWDILVSLSVIISEGVIEEIKRQDRELIKNLTKNVTE